MRQFYSFIFHYLEENKLKISRWKLQQYILIPTKKLLMKWRIANNSQCNFCGQDEDYLHYFISCPYLKELWVKIHILYFFYFWCLMTLSAVFQLYHGDQFQWWKKPKYWVKIQQILNKTNIESFVTSKHMVFGYKIFDKDYFDFNFFL